MKQLQAIDLISGDCSFRFQLEHLNVFASLLMAAHSNERTGSNFRSPALLAGTLEAVDPFYLDASKQEQISLILETIPPPSCSCAQMESQRVRTSSLERTNERPQRLLRQSSPDRVKPQQVSAS